MAKQWFSPASDSLLTTIAMLGQPRTKRSSAYVDQTRLPYGDDVYVDQSQLPPYTDRGSAYVDESPLPFAGMQGPSLEQLQGPQRIESTSNASTRMPALEDTESKFGPLAIRDPRNMDKGEGGLSFSVKPSMQPPPTDIQSVSALEPPASAKPPPGQASKQLGLQTPEPYEPSTGLMLLELLGGMGQSMLQQRAMGQAQKQTQRSQGMANLINTLSPGAGARGTQAQPEMGTGGMLLSALGEIPSVIRQKRQLESKGEQQQYQNQLAGMETGSRLMRDAAMADRAGRPLPRRGKVVGHRIIDDVTGDVIYEGKEGQEIIFDRESGRALDKNTGELVWSVPRDPDEPKLQPGLRSWSQAMASKLAQAGGTEEDISRLIREKYGDSPLVAEMEGFALDRYYKDIAPGGSASERMTLADVDSTIDQFRRIKEQHANAEVKGPWYRAFQILDIGPEITAEDSDRFATMFRAAYPNSSLLDDNLTAFGLVLARAIQGSRPSDNDLKVAARLMPLITDTDELARMKFEFIDQLFTARKSAIENLTGGSLRSQANDFLDSLEQSNAVDEEGRINVGNLQF